MSHKRESCRQLYYFCQRTKVFPACRGLLGQQQINGMHGIKTSNMTSREERVGESIIDFSATTV